MASSSSSSSPPHFGLDLNLPPPPETDETHHHQHQDIQNPPAAVNFGEGVGRENDGIEIIEVLESDDETHDQDFENSEAIDAGDGMMVQENGRIANDQDSTSPAAVDAGGRIIQEKDRNERVDPAVSSEEDEKEKRKRRFAALLDVARILTADGRLKDNPMDPSVLMNDGGFRIQDNASSSEEESDDQDEVEEEEETPEQVQTTPPPPPPAVQPEGRRKSERIQVLPNKYRDSVVEPITNLSSRHNRTSSSSSRRHVPTKSKRRRIR
ncbi:hypothetical protein ACH5RR_021077 [Cinchona calisaya]|uniref:Uncharacterized protein n=1 Tax=Cinchona calisaya TaxID=153742 RepID=A0ABD2ZGF5_9GENT